MRVLSFTKYQKLKAVPNSFKKSMKVLVLFATYSYHKYVLEGYLNES